MAHARRQHAPSIIKIGQSANQVSSTKGDLAIQVFKQLVSEGEPEATAWAQAELILTPGSLSKCQLGRMAESDYPSQPQENQAMTAAKAKSNGKHKTDDRFRPTDPDEMPKGNTWPARWLRGFIRLREALQLTAPKMAAFLGVNYNTLNRLDKRDERYAARHSPKIEKLIGKVWDFKKETKSNATYLHEYLLQLGDPE